MIRESMKKQILITALLLAIPALSFAGNDKEVRPSITRNADKVKYAGNVNAGISFIGAYLNTTHGVIFPKCNIYTGGSAEYSFLWGRNFINVAADGKWFYPRKGRVQGYIGLEAGASFQLPGISFNDANGENEAYPSDAQFFIRPGLGMAVNFNKVSLDIGIKCYFSPYFIMSSRHVKNMWAPIPSFGIGLWF